MPPSNDTWTTIKLIKVFSVQQLENFGVTIMSIPPFETTFAVPLSCEDCIKDVSSSLYKLAGQHIPSLPSRLCRH